MNSKYHTSAIKSLSPENLEVILQAIQRFGNNETLLLRYFPCYRQAFGEALAADYPNLCPADDASVRWCPPWRPPCTPAALSPCGSAQSSDLDSGSPFGSGWWEFIEDLDPDNTQPESDLFCHEGHWDEPETRPKRWKGVEVAENDQNDSSDFLPPHTHGQAEAWIRLASLCLCLMGNYRPPGKNACEQIENYVRELYAGTYGQVALARRDEEMNRQ